MFRESDVAKLETNGLHRIVRHPLYLGTIVFLLGMAVLFPFYKNIVAVFIIVCYTLVGALLEEKKLVNYFGDTYRKYQQKVPMIIPGLKLFSK